MPCLIFFGESAVGFEQQFNVGKPDGYYVSAGKGGTPVRVYRQVND